MTEVARSTRERRLEMAAIVGLVALATLLRVVDLTGESLWYDEAYSIWAASMPELGSLRLLWDWQVVFPLYYLVLHNWIEVFGSSVVAVRTLSVIGGALAIPAVYAWIRTAHGTRAALLTALLLAVNPWHVWYSQEARMYSWAILVTLGALWCFARIARGGRWPWLLGYVVCVGLTFFLHYYVGWVMLAHNLYYVAHAARSSGRSLRGFWVAIRGWIMAQVVIVLIALPALAVFWEQFSHSHWDWLAQRYAAPGIGDLADLFAAYAFGTTYAGPSLLRWACVGVGGLVVVWAFAKGAMDRDVSGLAFLAETGLVVGVPVAAVFVLGQVASVWVPRYLVLFLPAWLALVARGIDSLPTRWLGVGVVALVLVGTSLSLASMYDARQKEDWRGVAAYLYFEAQPTDLLVLMDEECRVPFDYYGADLFTERRVEVGRFSDEATLDAAAKEIVSQRGDGRIWLVVSHADGSGLRERLDAAPELIGASAPDFVGIELWAYDSR